MNARLILAATIFVASAASAPADVVDGVLITQAGAEAGNVTPGDAPGFPVTLSQPGLYKLASNLTVPASRKGLDPTVDDVTIDLNGYRLHAFGARDSIAILSDRSNITIRNGTIAGFADIAMILGSYPIIEDTRIVGNGYTHTVDVRDRGVLRNNQVVSNVLYTDAGSFYCSALCLIAGNIVANNTGNAIAIASGLVTGNAVLDNGWTGVRDFYGAANDVGLTGNVVFGNTPNLGTGAGSFDKNWCGAEC